MELCALSILNTGMHNQTIDGARGLQCLCLIVVTQMAITSPSRANMLLVADKLVPGGLIQSEQSL